MPSRRRAPAQFIGFVGLAPVDFEAPFTPAIEIGWRLARTRLGQRLRHRRRSRRPRACLRQLGFDDARLVHGRVEHALAAGHGEDRHDPRPGRRLPASGAAAGPQAGAATCSTGSNDQRSASCIGHITGSALLRLDHRTLSLIFTATKRRSPSLLARRRSADLRPSFFRLSMRLLTSSGGRQPAPARSRR